MTSGTDRDGIAGSPAFAGRHRQVSYRPLMPSRVRAEVQRLDSAHEVVGFGPHTHDFFEVAVFDRSGGVHAVAGQPSAAIRGEAWLLGPGMTHDLTQLGDAQGWLLILGAEALNIPVLPPTSAPWPGHVLLTGFGNVDAAGRAVAITLGRAGLQRWTGWMVAIQAELAAAELGHEHVVQALLHQLLVDAARRCPPAIPYRSRALVTQALTVVEEGFRLQLSLADVADALAVSPGHLTAVVRRTTGRPLGEWILERRLSEARQLLTDTDDPLVLISAAVGFADVGQFTRQFRRHHGWPPGAWRRAIRSTIGAAARTP